METTKKQKLQAVLRKIRREYMDSIANSIVNENEKSYEQIAREHGVSRQFVINTARDRNCGRKQFVDEEVSNG